MSLSYRSQFKNSQIDIKPCHGFHWPAGYEDDPLSGFVCPYPQQIRFFVQ